MSGSLRIVVAGLSITSSWGNGHATTYRSLLREVSAQGHDVLFLERDVPWYASSRDLASPEFCRVGLYQSLEQLAFEYGEAIRQADCVIVGSYVPEGVAVSRWILEQARGVVAFYDIDTPVTLAKLERGDYEYISPELIARFALYLSFTGGPTLRLLEERFGSPMARVLYCSVDPAIYHPQAEPLDYDLGYLGTYGADRQSKLDQLLLGPAAFWPEGRFIVAGPLYPDSIEWPSNVERIDHLAPAEHRAFYNRQRFTLNVTRRDMVLAGFSPSVRLFEAAACGTPIISDYWAGLETIFQPDKEVFVASSAADSMRYLRSVTETARLRVGERARKRVLAEHTAAHRAHELMTHLVTAMESRSRNSRAVGTSYSKAV